jgi:hypothetical protein
MPMDQMMEEGTAPSGLEEIRAHLTAALELLDNMGGSDTVEPPKSKAMEYGDMMNRGPE